MDSFDFFRRRLIALNVGRIGIRRYTGVALNDFKIFAADVLIPTLKLLPLEHNRWRFQRWSIFDLFFKDCLAGMAIVGDNRKNLTFVSLVVEVDIAHFFLVDGNILDDISVRNVGVGSQFLLLTRFCYIHIIIL
jgi:hypothetical protein